MRLIDADALFHRLLNTDPNTKGRFCDGVAKAMEFIINTPTIEVEPVRHGLWIWKDFHGDGSLILCCSECLETEGARESMNYCPFCGVKMDGDQ